MKRLIKGRSFFPYTALFFEFPSKGGEEMDVGSFHTEKREHRFQKRDL
ncbi:hypothetical protein P9654_16485 [Bacillus atrophaeus]|nr:hypothetical protein [Bacillus atrophaeus]